MCCDVTHENTGAAAGAGAVDEVFALGVCLKHRVMVMTWKPLHGGWCWADLCLKPLRGGLSETILADPGLQRAP